MPPTWIETSPIFTEDSSTLSPIPSNQAISPKSFDAGRQSITIILGGYSYGSLLASHLPTIDLILQGYAKIAKGSAEAEIRLRAQTLSTQWNKESYKHDVVERGRSLGAHTPSGCSSRNLGIVFGGEESEPGSRRASRDSNRSMEFIRRSVDRSRRKLGPRTRSNETNAEGEEHLDISNMPEPQTCYLLISPLLPPISLFATMFSRFSKTSEDVDHHFGSRHPSAALDETLVRHPTLAVYGDKDFFTSPKRLRRWAQGLADQPHSLFRFKEIRNAGHFWQEDGVEAQMRVCITEWLQDIVGSQEDGI